MIGWETFSEWLTALALASLTWASGLLAPALPINADGTAGVQASGSSPPGLMLSWAQADDEPPVEQVEEGGGGDVELLDEGARATVDAETIDAEPANAADDEDIELLDQGLPPAAASTAPPPENAAAPATVAAAPTGDVAAAYVAPAYVTGPWLPEGFGTGDVHVSAGRSVFPVGLTGCHVGAVTGRAYVGIDCGDDVSVVGHAPSFDDFPFVADADFPFGGDELVIAANQEDRSDDVSVFVSAAGGNRAANAEERAAPVIETSGRASVEFAQREHDRDPRIRVTDKTKNRSKDSTTSTKETRQEAKGAKKGDTGENSRSRANGKDERENSDKQKKQKSDGKNKKKKGDPDKRDKRKSSRKR